MAPAQRPGSERITGEPCQGKTCAGQSAPTLGRLHQASLSGLFAVEKELKGLLVPFPIEKLLQKPSKDARAVHLGEQGRRRAQLQVVRRSEDLACRARVMGEQRLCAFAESGAEQRMGHVRSGFRSAPDRVAAGQVGSAESLQLRKNVPHPV